MEPPATKLVPVLLATVSLEIGDSASFPGLFWILLFFNSVITFLWGYFVAPFCTAISFIFPIIETDFSKLL